MKRKKIRILIGNQYVDVTFDFDDDEIDGECEEMMAGYAFFTAYVAGDIKVEIEDIDNEEHCHDNISKVKH